MTAYIVHLRQNIKFYCDRQLIAVVQPQQVFHAPVLHDAKKTVYAMRGKRVVVFCAERTRSSNKEALSIRTKICSENSG